MEIIYNLWIKRLEDDEKYKFQSNQTKYISPEKFDLAERRFYLWNFFDAIEKYFEQGRFDIAKELVIKIHQMMMNIHNMIAEVNKGKLLERQTREACIQIIKEAQALDLKLADELEKIIIGKENMNNNKQYKYHCQHQAEDFARAIINVPTDYPLQKEMPKDFQLHFSQLCNLAKSIYLDMAKQPELYGFMLVDIESEDHNLARDGYRTIHRFVDTLCNLTSCSKLENHQLIVDAEEFKKSCKKGTGLVSGPVPKYELILARLVYFGFRISNFDGKSFNAKISFFTIEYPENPKMIDTIKTYFECWSVVKWNRDSFKLPHDYHHNYYRFDYKITADCAKIPMIQWLKDEADYLGYSDEQKKFSVAFYEYSLQYKNISFDGDYNYKSKRIARITQAGYIAMGESIFLVHIKIKNIDKYIDVINSLPENIKLVFSKDNCRHCNFQGATDEYCKFRVNWTFNQQSHTGCSHACFYFNDFKIEHIPYYWRLLELEYDLKKV